MIKPNSPTSDFGEYLLADGRIVRRYGADDYDGVSANGWFIMSPDGLTAEAGPFCGAGVALKHS